MRPEVPSSPCPRRRRPRRSVWLAVPLLLGTAARAWAQETPGTQSSQPSPPLQQPAPESPTPRTTERNWAPPEPELGGWDWARIDSGEWLKGEMIVAQRDKMTFDSDEFDEVEIDWEDVLDLRLARPRVFRRRDNQIFTGVGDLRDGLLRITQANGEVVEIPRDQIVTITYSEELELRRWSVKLGANLAARSGNTDQQDFGANAQLRRDATYTRLESRYNGAIGRVDGTNTTNNHRSTTTLDFLVTHRFFVRLPSFEFYTDEFQNIDQRYTTGAGVGYEVIDHPLAELRVAVGGASQVTANSDGSRSSDGAVLAGAELALDLPRDLDLDLRYSLQLLVTDLGRTAHSTSAVLSFEIWKPIDLDVGFYWDRIEKPEPDDNGDRPKSDDLRLTVGLSVEF